MKKRDITSDLLKGIAVILMIQVHIMELFALSEISESLIGKISFFLGGPPAAPIFMTIMGFYLAKSNKQFNNLLKRGVLIFIGGISLNIGLNFNILFKHFTNNLDFAITPYGYIFGADILPLAGLSIIIISSLSKLFEKNYYLYFIMALVITFITPYLIQIEKPSGYLSYINAFIRGDDWWSYFPLFPWLAYPLTGYSFYLLIDKIIVLVKNKLFKIYFLSFGLMFIGFTFSYALNISTELKLYYNHDIFFYLWCLVFISIEVFIFYELSQLIKNNIIFNYLSFVGKYVTAFYVFQWLIIGNIATEIFRTQNYLEILLWFIFITITVSILVYLFVLIKNKFYLR